jgi:hypothetical protein
VLLTGPLFALTLMSGCGGGSSEPYIVPLTPSETNLKFIAMAFTDATSGLERPPKDAEELKKYLKDIKGVGNPNEVLISPTDNKPYVIIWGKSPTGGPTEYKGMFPILAYEQVGAGGRRAVTDIRARPMTVPDEDFPKLKFIGGHTPSPK